MQTLPTIDPEPRRPLSISIISVLGFLAAGSVPLYVFSSMAQAVAVWYPPYLAFSGVVCLVMMIGLWKMKKWAGIGYPVFVLVNQIVLLATGRWNIFALMLPSIIVVFVLRNLNKMR